jgi:ATP-binding protein involved in chromosome partitioning
MEILETGIDTRDSLISVRLDSIKRIIVFASGKGGVGKSTLSAHTSYILSKNYTTGILDLDLHGPSIPLILGLNQYMVKESQDGIIPPEKNGLKIMSLEIFMRGRGSPLRGNSKYDIIKELFSITNFGQLDYLVVDMPPGTGDEFLAALEIFGNKGEMIFITAPSIVSWQVTRRAIEIARGKIKESGVIINMGKSETIHEECKKLRIKCLGNIDYYPYVIDGSIENLEKTEYLKKLNDILMNSNIIH